MNFRSGTTEGNLSPWVLSGGSAGEVKEGASFSDNPSILANVSDSILYTVIAQHCILNYLILRILVFSRLPDVYFEVCVCIYKVCSLSKVNRNPICMTLCFVNFAAISVGQLLIALHSGSQIFSSFPSLVPHCLSDVSLPTLKADR